MTPLLIATCEKARSGWSCDAELEALRDKFTQASTNADRKTAANQVQAHALQVVTHIRSANGMASARRATRSTRRWSFPLQRKGHRLMAP